MADLESVPDIIYTLRKVNKRQEFTESLLMTLNMRQEFTESLLMVMRQEFTDDIKLETV